MLEEKPEVEAIAVRAPSLNKQRRQMLIALGILLLALILVLLKDWRFWFSSAPSSKAPVSLERSIETPPVASSQTNERAAKTEGAKVKLATSTSAEPTPAIVATDRAVLPPLEIEVVSGRSRRTVQPASTSVRVDLQSDAEPSPIAANSPPETAAVKSPAAVVNASETVRLSRTALDAVARPVQPDYPLLAKQMKVQGSVVLQALIGKAGTIEDLHVLSGPAILSSAAMEAVKQWRFRPYYVSGEAVETQARITVNFTISTY
jgi:TonB family protein